MKLDCGGACTTYSATVVAGLVVMVLVLTGANAIAWDADLDPTFSDDGRTVFAFTGVGEVNDVAVQPDGKIVVVGMTLVSGTQPFTHHENTAIARLDASGELDPSFGGDGTVHFDVGLSELDDSAHAVAIQPDGKVVTVGFLSGGYMTVVRVNSDGSPDDATIIPFSVPASGFGVALQPDGKIVVAGTVVNTNSGYDFAVARLNENLSMDTSFSTDGLADWDFGDEGYDVANDVAVRPDGKIVLGGVATRSGKQVVGTMVFSETGGPQCLGWAEFSTDAHGEGLSLQPDGKAVVAGQRLTTGGDIAVARFNTNCGLDTTFSIDGMSVFSLSPTEEEAGLDVAVQHDGKIVVVGSLLENTWTRVALVRWNADGSFDDAFNGFPLSSYASFNFDSVLDATGRAVAMQPDGKLVIGAVSDAANGFFPAVARVRGDEDLVFTDGFESGGTAWWGDRGP